MNFNPTGPNQVWAGDVWYLKTGEGWQDLAIVVDLFGRRIVGWHTSKRMTTDLIEQDVAAYVKYYNLEWLHSSNGDQLPIEYENSFRKVSGLT